VRKLLLSGFGTGFLPIAPGTWGSFAAMLLWLIAVAAAVRTGQDPWFLVAITVAGVVAASLICVVFGDYAIVAWGRKDPGKVVIDEFAGQWVSLLPVAFMPTGRAQIFAAGVAFLFFRVSDVIKPPPAHQAEFLPAGVGILADDLMAGVYAGLAMWLLILALRGTMW
jgi:phosphatidylglycerophosphatase A